MPLFLNEMQNMFFDTFISCAEFKNTVEGIWKERTEEIIRTLEVGVTGGPTFQRSLLPSLGLWVIMKAVSSSETSANIYYTKLRNIAKDS